MKSKTCLFVAALIFLAGLLLFVVQPAVARPGPGLLSSVVVAQAGQVKIDLTSEFIGVVAGAILSLLFSYAPGLAPAYGKLDDTWKRLVMLLLMAAVTAGVMGLGCAGIFGGIECTQNGFVNAVLTFFFAAMSNQTTHQLSPRVGAKAKPAKTARIADVQIDREAFLRD